MTRGLALLHIEAELDDLFREHRAGPYAYTLSAVRKTDLPSHKADAIAEVILLAERRAYRQERGHIRRSETNDWLSHDQLRSRWAWEVRVEPHSHLFDEKGMGYLQSATKKTKRPVTKKSPV